MQPLTRLAEIASELDEHGMLKEADIVTDIMRRVAEQTPEELRNMMPSANLIGQYDAGVWKQTLTDKYNKFKALVDTATSGTQPINPNVATGLYDEMMYIASNYLKNDSDAFNMMKWVTTHYKSLFDFDSV